MHKYLDNIRVEFPGQLGAIVTSPAADHLFQVRPYDKSQKLPEPQAVAFHHTTAQLIFLSSRCRREYQTAVAFLTTRVKASGEDNWGEFKRVLKYLMGSRRLVLTLEADDLTIIKWWFDASFHAHDNYKGHTGAMMSLGRGDATKFSRRKKCRARAPPRTKLLASTSTSHKHSGANSFLNPRAILLSTTSFTKITKMTSSWKPMDAGIAQIGPNTSRPDTLH